MREYFLESNWVLFSHWTKEDIGLAHSLWGDSEVTKYISKDGRFSDQEIHDRLDFEMRNESQFGVQYWPVFERESNEFIGCCGLRPYDTEKNIYEIGIHLKPEHWGKSLGMEAVRAVMRYAFNVLDVSELFAGHNPNNISSKKLLEKLGFQYIGDKFYKPTGLYHPSYRCRKHEV